MTRLTWLVLSALTAIQEDDYRYSTSIIAYTRELISRHRVREHSLIHGQHRKPYILHGDIQTVRSLLRASLRRS
jgi:hypothetical protein